MKNLMTVGAALLLTTTAATAGGLDRSGQGVGIIFEEGNSAELSFGSVSPSISGDATGTGLTGASGNMAGKYSQVGIGIKNQIADNLSVSLVFDQPFGASVDYNDTTGGYYATGAKADVSSTAITAVARYSLSDSISVHAGLRRQSVKADITIPLGVAGNYDFSSESSSGNGFLVGAAYERPEIAMRFALTYNSSVDHDIEGTETCYSAAICSGTPETTKVTTPESINLDFQTGVAADTLVFGSIRYAKWTQFDFKPSGYATITSGGSLQKYDEDTMSYNVGVGRKFSDTWSGALSFGYEAAQGGFAGNLAPTDGNKSVGLGATYTGDGFKVTGGVRYVMLGDADTEHPVAALAGTTAAEFRDNSALAFGLKVSTSF